MNALMLCRAVIWAVLCLACLSAAAQTQDEPSSSETIQNLQTALDFVEKDLERRELTGDAIEHIREQVDQVADSALRIRAKALRQAEEKTRLLNALGPKPAEGEPPEPESVQQNRRKLEAEISEYRGQIKSANVLLARVDTLRTRLVREEFGVLTGILGQRTRTPLAPGLIAEAVSQVPSRLAGFRQTLGQWWQGIEFDRERFGTLMWWLVLLVVVVSVVVPVRNWVLRRYGPDHRDESPSFTRRFRVMLAVGLGNVVIPVVSIVGLYVVFLNSAVPTPEVHQFALVLTFTLCQFFLITGISDAAMSPDYPNWRISHFTNVAAVRLHRSIRVFAWAVVVFNLAWIPLSGEQAAEQLVDVLVMDVAHGELLTVFGAFAVVVLAAAMLNILRRGNWWFVQTDEQGQQRITSTGRLVKLLFTVAKLGLLLSIAAVLIGYVNFGIFLSQRIVWSLLLIAFAYLMREFINGLCSQAAGEDSTVSALLQDRLGYSPTGSQRLMFWVMLVVDIVVSVAAIILLLLIWGVHATDVWNAAAKLFYGVKIGDYTFSLVDIGVALAIFVVLFIGVRLLQGFLSNRILAQTVPDVGVRDALTTGVGYAGVIIAAFIAISSLGLELSQLAIIFGALSVGIGFGLQHVVNNFVSGLILLMHRPVKAGDWIVVGQHEGYVKKINVVATELQTFDNAEVILPNSQLVSSEVLNWTHKSTVARVIVKVSVSYDSDPHEVRSVLLACAAQHADVLHSPAPAVVFKDFGESALMFELRFFIKQADYMLVIASDLRYAITDAFREKGIVIPYPQRDLHIKAEPAAAGEVSGDRAGKDASGGRVGERFAEQPEQGEQV